MEKTLLNLIPGACSPEVHLSQYDKGRAVPFKLAEGKSAYSVPDGSEIVVQATKPSGLGFVVPVTFDGDTATMTITETMSNEYGRFPAELSITNNGNRIGTANFVMNIERSPHPEGTIDGDAESLLPELTLLVERIEAAADSVDEDTQTVTEAKAEVLQAKADTLQAKADTLTARDDALQAKADAITAKESAEASAQAAAESAQEAEDTLSEYAKVDGYYEEMAVGSAEQLLSTQFVEDSVPYKFRTSGGSKDIGNREYDEIVGGSIVWNQLASLLSMSTMTYNGITYTYNSATNTYTVSGTASATSAITLTESNINLLTNHVYYLPDIRPSGTVGMYFVNGYYANYSKMFKMTQNETNRYLTLRYQSGVAPQNEVLKMNCQLFDLTAMFGSTIADYIYSLESAEAGKGVAFFKSLFPNDYYPYNAGELLSVEGLQSHDTVGFNQWDEEWQLGYINPSTGDYSPRSDRICSKNYIPVLPDTAYYFKDPSPAYMTAVWYDENQARIRNYSPHNEVITSPSNARYLRFSMPSEYGTTYKNDICINLSWSGWRNGEYEPYKKHSYALDSSLTLRGILKLNAQNELYFDGDVYSHDGKVQRKYGVVDLGSLTWNYQADSLRFSTTSLSSVIKKPSTDDGIANILCGIYKAGSYASVSVSNPPNMTLAVHQTYGYVYVVNTSYTDATAFKTAMSGVMLVYELATPTEETAEPYASPQNVDDFGTEEYISGNLVPVGHNTKYPANLRDKLQHLPNMADSDGAYLIRQTNKQMSLELFRIPKAPTTDGTYTLKATVSGGTPTYIWEAVE